MGDYPVGKAPLFHIMADMLQKVISHKNHVLVDELYCQIFRQVTRNSNAKSIERGFMLLVILSGLARPHSSDLCDILMTYLDSVSQVNSLAKAVIRNLSMRLRKRRLYAPSVKEMVAGMHGQPIPLTLTLPASTVVIHVSPLTTAKDAVDR